MLNIKQVNTNCCYKSYCFSDNYYSDDENDTELDPINIYDEYSHREIIDRCDFGQNHMIHARLSSNKFLIQEQVQTSILDHHTLANALILSTLCCCCGDYSALFYS